MGELKRLTRKIKIQASYKATKIFGHRSSSKLELDWDAIDRVQYRPHDNVNQHRNGNPDLCDACAGIPFGEMSWQGYRLHYTVESLVSSADSCPLCRLVKYQLSGIVERGRVESHIRLGWDEVNIGLDTHRKDWRVWLRAYGLYMGELQWFASSHSPYSVIAKPLFSVEDMTAAYPKVNAEAMSLLKNLVEECFHERGKCSNFRHLSTDEAIPCSPLLPRRVIDVGKTSKCSLHLHESGNDERAQYTTLSHRWGSKLTFKTTMENINLLHEEIDYDALPLSFKDAVTLTRALNVRYLWIDAICIIQDNHSDWLEQAPVMGRIYKNSHCTFAAHSAADSTVGFLESTPESLRPIPFVPARPGKNVWVPRHSIEEVLKRGLCIGIPHTFKQSIDFSHIKKRGWVVQELTLSPRVAHFSDGYIYWDCEHTTMPRSVAHKAEPSIQSRVVMKRIGTGINFVESWINLVTEYSKCDLTFGSDKLFAISGIAAEWQTHLEEDEGKQYHAGVFECTLPQALLWYPTGETLTRFEERAPSWSWASVDGPLQFMNAHKSIAVADFKMEGLDGHMYKLTGTASIMEAELTTHRMAFGAGSLRAEGGAPSALRPRAVEVSGYILEVPGYWSGRHDFEWKFGHYKGGYSGQAVMDDSSTVPGRVFVARICTLRTNWDEYECQREFLLILEPVNKSLIRFRRIGVGTTLANSWGDFLWPEPQEIIIV